VLLREAPIPLSAVSGSIREASVPEYISRLAGRIFLALGLSYDWLRIGIFKLRPIPPPLPLRRERPPPPAEDILSLGLQLRGKAEQRNIAERSVATVAS
jgi:hypothetical protein